jgi:hypothetical protein
MHLIKRLEFCLHTQNSCMNIHNNQNARALIEFDVNKNDIDYFTETKQKETT